MSKNAGIGSFNVSLMNHLGQIIEVLETSSIAEEKVKDQASKFWLAYKKISGEYDDNLLERCNSDMDTLMLFAGLFSAVNTAFIIAMQPNPADTTNELLVQFMQHSWNASSVAAESMVLPEPVPSFSSSKIWMQALAYASLTFSLLAAIGAVLGKQWLGYYKTQRFDSGPLGDRCKHRHRKFKELKKWKFEHVLQSFPVLIQISLALFILSLAASTWIQYRVISFVIIALTACGALFYACFSAISLIYPDSPFQTPISSVISHLRDEQTNVQSHEDSIADAMSWILDTSTNPDVLSLAFNLMVTMSNQPDHFNHPSQPNQPNLYLLSSPFFDKAINMFKKCFDSTPLDETNAMLLGKAFIHISCKIVGATEKLNAKFPPGWEHWSRWRKLCLSQTLEQCNISFRQMKEKVPADQREQVDARIPLRMALSAGMDKFVNPDNHQEYVELVWQGRIGSEFNLPDVDWLMDFAKHLLDAEEFHAAGDALLLLSHLKNVSQASIVPFLDSSPQSPTLRHCAIRAACRAIDINSSREPSFVKAVLTAISPPTQRGHNSGDSFAAAIRLLTLTDWSEHDLLVGFPLIDIQHLIFLVLSAPSFDNTVKFGRYCHALINFMHRANSPDHKRVAVHIAYRIGQDLAKITPSLGGPLTEVPSTLSPALLTLVPTEFNSLDYFSYLRLIFTLSSRPDWLPHLEADGHIKRCIKIIPRFRDKPFSSFFYLAGIFLRIEVAYGQQQSALLITPSQWWDLTRMAWHVAGRLDHNNGSDSDVLGDSDGIDILKDLLTTTKSHIPQNASISDLTFLRGGLGNTIKKLEFQQSPPSSDIIDTIKELRKYEPPS